MPCPLSPPVSSGRPHTNFVTATAAKKLKAFFFIRMMFLAYVLDNMTAPNLLNLLLCTGLVARK
eukprot:7489678-Heterocapsa_arctica.AAC.1